MTEQSPSYLDRQPEALRLADLLLLPGILPDSVLSGAGHELRRLHAENQALQTGYNAGRLEIESLKARVDEVGRIARENRSRAVIDLEVQISKLKFAVECYEKDIAAIKAALPAGKYDSKDWREGCTLERIEWLHGSYKGAKDEVERLTADVLNLQTRVQELEAMLDAVGAGGVEPLRRAKCLHRIAEPVPAAVWQEQTGKESDARCKIIESCKSCQYCAGRQGCTLATKEFDNKQRPDVPPDWCPLPRYTQPTI